MAKQTRATTLKGAIGNVTYFESKTGSRARRKSSVESSRLFTDKAFQRTRENMAGFSNCGKAGKTLRNAVRVITMNTSAGNVLPRLTKKMIEIVKSDRLNDRGFRNAADGDLELLKGF